MLWLPRPYPDEIVGSALGRAARFTGLSISHVVRSATGLACAQASFLLPSGLGRMADLMGLELEELLERHTIFPYATAFIPAPVRAFLKETALCEAEARQPIAGLTGSFAQPARFRRYCERCAFEDTRRYGESYWHRVHLLPGVEVCLEHNRPLRAIAVRVQRGGTTADTAMPGDLEAHPCRSTLRKAVRYRFAWLSEAVLLGEKDWTREVFSYRDRAFALGYGFGKQGTGIASEAFGAEFRAFFGQKFLAELGCNYPADQRRAWPAAMLRPNRPVILTAVKHILMETFLQCAPSADAERFGYGGVHAKGEDKKERRIRRLRLRARFLGRRIPDSLEGERSAP